MIRVVARVWGNEDSGETIVCKGSMIDGNLRFHDLAPGRVFLLNKVLDSCERSRIIAEHVHATPASKYHLHVATSVVPIKHQ